MNTHVGCIIGRCVVIIFNYCTFHIPWNSFPKFSHKKKKRNDGVFVCTDIQVKHNISKYFVIFCLGNRTFSRWYVTHYTLLNINMNLVTVHHPMFKHHHHHHHHHNIESNKPHTLLSRKSCWFRKPPTRPPNQRPIREYISFQKEKGKINNIWIIVPANIILYQGISYYNSHIYTYIITAQKKT